MTHSASFANKQTQTHKQTVCMHTYLHTFRSWSTYTNTTHTYRFYTWKVHTHTYSINTTTCLAVGQHLVEKHEKQMHGERLLKIHYLIHQCPYSGNSNPD